MNIDSKKKDFTEGPLFFKILTFTLPLMAVGVLQVLYNAADKMVVGQFSGDPNALGAIGSTSTVNAMIINLLIGLAGGAGVIAAQYYGAKRYEELRRAVSTAMIISLIGGVLFGVIGIAVAEPIMRLMTKEELVESAALYVRITCVGVPAASVYNFASAITRGVGDSKTPLLVGSLSGLVNVGLNLVFVILFDMSVDGVAWATVISQYLSAAAMVIHLIRKRGECFGLDPKSLSIDPALLRLTLALGIPQGIQSSVINLANMICSATFNAAFSVAAISANAVAGTLDIVIYTCMNCFGQAVTTFAGQNVGAGKTDRAKRSLLYSLVQVVTVSAIISLFLRFLGPAISELFVDAADPNRAEVLSLAKENWFEFICYFYFIHGIVSVLSGFVRGAGYSVSPAICSFMGDAATKVLWMLLVFPIFSDSIKWYNLGHVAGWLVNLILMGTLTVIALRKLSRTYTINPDTEAAAAGSSSAI